MRRLRCGVLSAGAWSETSHLPALSAHPDVELVVVTGRDRARAARLADTFGAQRSAEDWESALDMGLDLVVVSSPPAAHRDQVVRALDSGAHVLVEKPMAISPLHAAEMTRAAEANRRTLLVGFGWATVPAFRTAQAAVRGGALGEIEQVTLHLDVNNRELLEGRVVAAWTDAGSYEVETYVDIAVSGGGAGAVAMSHQFGLAQWMVERPALRIAAAAFPRSARLDLHGQAVVEWEGGAAGSVVCTSVHPTAGDPCWRMDVAGSEAELHLDSRFTRLWTVRRDGSSRDMELAADAYAYDPQGPTNRLISIALGESSSADGLDASLGEAAVRMVDGYYRSSSTGAWASLAEVGDRHVG